MSPHIIDFSLFENLKIGQDSENYTENHMVPPFHKNNDNFSAKMTKQLKPQSSTFLA